MLMWYIISSFIFTKIIGCHVEGIESDQWMFGYRNGYILDSYEGIVKSFTLGNITDFLDAVVDNVIYLDVNIEGNTLNINTTDRFKQYEDEQPYAYMPEISIYIVFHCTTGSRELNFRQPIKDTNNHQPYFTKDIYRFKFAMNLPPGMLITEFVEVEAIDVDITNSRVKFSLEDNDILSLGHGVYEDRKSYYPTLITKQNITLPFKKKITITVSDVGEPIRNSSAYIELILVSPGDIIPNPVFSKSLYIIDYNKKYGVLDVSDNIELSYGGGFNTKINQFGLQEYININITIDDVNKGNFSLELRQKFPENIIYKEYVTCEIVAENEGAERTGQATILINFV